MARDSAAPFSLDGKVCLVTGGSRGLGRAISTGFAAHGAEVVVASRKENACRELAAELRSEFGVDAVGLACHVGRWTDCDRLVADTLERFGRIDVLVNNAGMSPLYDSLPGVTEDLFDKVMGVNLKGPFRLSALAGAHMEAGAGGSIINVSSIAAVQPRQDQIPYAAAKAGLNAMTVAMARSFGPTVRVNAIMPGSFLTDISLAWDQDAFAQEAATSIHLRRGGEADEIVGAALYFASAASSYTTGSVLKVDGGAAYAPA
jgi:NAD(P)-dependent dehydrogenase (short-subunit alcohol dehydrogenase family)